MSKNNSTLGNQGVRPAPSTSNVKSTSTGAIDPLITVWFKSSLIQKEFSHSVARYATLLNKYNKSSAAVKKLKNLRQSGIKVPKSLLAPKVILPDSQPSLMEEVEKVRQQYHENISLLLWRAKEDDVKRLDHLLQIYPDSAPTIDSILKQSVI